MLPVAWLAQLLGGLPRVGKLTSRVFEHVRVDDSLDRVVRESPPKHARVLTKPFTPHALCQAVRDAK